LTTEVLAQHISLYLQCALLGHVYGLLTSRLIEHLWTKVPTTS